MRFAHRLLSHARLVLGGFVLALLAAAIAPLLRSVPAQWICGAQGPVLLSQASPEAPDPMDEHGLECALCLQLHSPVSSAPAPLAPTAEATPAPAWAWIESTQTLLTLAPLPARGPPVIS